MMIWETPFLNGMNMINREQALLVKLSEECAELSQRSTKALRFGMLETQPGQDRNNLARLLDEFLDVMTVMEMLITDSPYESQAEKFCSNEENDFEHRSAKIDKYMKYSQALGIVQWQPTNTSQSTQSG